jgi:hypothetical protein
MRDAEVRVESRGSFEVKDGIGVFRPVGEHSLVEIVDRVKDTIGRCRDQRLPGLLVTARGVYGVAMPTLIDRFLAIEEWAETAQGMLVVALVVHPQYIHPRKFGVKVAADFGLTADVFTSELNARAWLASKT